QENASAFFSRAGLKLVQKAGAREYRGTLAGLPGIEVRYLSASEIAGQLASGAAHLGVTGEDLIREMLPDPAGSVELLTPLG
ncbi:ATP phosphoribosyltransferase catalytic subunit HisG, partial [Acinetobacter baumannii]